MDLCEINRTYLSVLPWSWLDAVISVSPHVSVGIYHILRLDVYICILYLNIYLSIYIYIYIYISIYLFIDTYNLYLYSYFCICLFIYIYAHIKGSGSIIAVN